MLRQEVEKHWGDTCEILYCDQTVVFAMDKEGASRLAFINSLTGKIREIVCKGATSELKKQMVNVAQSEGVISNEAVSFIAGYATLVANTLTREESDA